MRLQPIRIFCFHQVSDTFDESTMMECDWLPTEVFKQRIGDFKGEGYTFISLPEAQKMLRRDWFRCKKYAVLTADDGWASLKNILPWLNEQQIPITLFLNPKYLDGKHYRDRATEMYITDEEAIHLYEQYPLVTIGSHGWEHIDAMRQTEKEFRESIKRTQDYLKRLPNYIPFHAYTWGHWNTKRNEILTEVGMNLVYMDGGKNYNDHDVIHRELMK